MEREGVKECWGKLLSVCGVNKEKTDHLDNYNGDVEDWVRNAGYVEALWMGVRYGRGLGMVK